MRASQREAAARAAEIFQGRSCFRQGLATSACPHKEGTSLWEWWQKGWSLEAEVVQIGRNAAPGGP